MSDLRNARVPDEMVEVEEGDGPSDDELKRVVALAKLQLRQLTEVAIAEEALAVAKEALRRTQEVDLVEAMATCGMAKFTLAENAGEVAIRRSYHGKKLTDEGALEWLAAHGRGSLEKTVVTVSFGRGDAKLAEKLLANLERYKARQSMAVKRERFVHDKTISAVGRELVEEQERLEPGDRVEPPLDLLGVYVRTAAVVTPPGAVDPDDFGPPVARSRRGRT